jgi:hypothetical protein
MFLEKLPIRTFLQKQAKRCFENRAMQQRGSA